MKDRETGWGCGWHPRFHVGPWSTTLCAHSIRSGRAWMRPQSHFNLELQASVSTSRHKHGPLAVVAVVVEGVLDPHRSVFGSRLDTDLRP